MKTIKTIQFSIAGTTAITLAEGEGLSAHAESARYRQK